MVALSVVSLLAFGIAAPPAFAAVYHRNYRRRMLRTWMMTALLMNVGVSVLCGIIPQHAADWLVLIPIGACLSLVTGTFVAFLSYRQQQGRLQ